MLGMPSLPNFLLEILLTPFFFDLAFEQYRVIPIVAKIVSIFASLARVIKIITDILYPLIEYCVFEKRFIFRIVKLNGYHLRTIFILENKRMKMRIAPAKSILNSDMKLEKSII